MMRHMSIAVAVTAALVAALAFAAAAVIQQGAAATVPEKESLRPSLFLALLRRPAWVAGALLDVFSFLIMGVALAFGPLVLVMPLASTDLLFALPLLAWRQGRWVTRTEMAGAACTAGGMAAFLAVLPVVSGTNAPGLADWILVLIAVVGLVVTLLAIGIRWSGTARTMLYAAAAGSMLALLDAITKSTADLFRNDGLATFAHWEPYALIAVGIVGLLLVQSSYQAGSLEVSLPVIDTVEPVGSVVMGAVVFEEPLASSWALAVQVVGAMLAVTGIVILSRSTKLQT